MKLTVIGTGYVGLIVGNCLAKQGHNVVCLDTNKDKIKLLNSGISPIYEEDLEDLIYNNLKNNSISYTTNLDIALTNSEIIFMAVGTPSKDDGNCDLTYLNSALDSIIEYEKRIIEKKIKYLFIKSTVSVGTAKYVRNNLVENGINNIIVVSNPEFLREGSSVYDFLNPDRIIIGCMNKDLIKDIVYDLYKYYVDRGVKILFMGNESAELSKYACNSFLATKISFANEIANLSKSIGANYDDVKKAMGSDSRISSKFLNAGPGYGGSCFPKDVRALINLGFDLDLIKAGYKVNENQKVKVFEMVDNYINLNHLKKKVVLWGCTFKPGTDDIRESPSIKMVNKLLENGYCVSVHDPVGMENFKKIYLDRIMYLDDKYDFDGSSALIVMVNWDEYFNIDYNKLSGVAIFDAFGLLDGKLSDDMYYERIGK